MKTLLLSLLIALIPASAAVYSAAQPTTRETQKTPTTKPATAINKFCAVDRENPVDPAVPTVTYEGKVIGFCCEDCVPKFKKNPAKYMKDLK